MQQYGAKIFTILTIEKPPKKCKYFVIELNLFLHFENKLNWLPNLIPLKFPILNFVGRDFSKCN